MDFEPIEKFACTCIILMVLLIFGAGILVGKYLF